MRKIILIAILTGVIMGILFALYQPALTEQDLQVFGDSLAEDYAKPLSKKLKLQLDNRAIGGSNVAGQLQQVIQFGQRKTKYKLLMVGYNDAYLKTDISSYKQNLSKAITTMAHNADSVYIGTPPNHYNYFKPEVTNGVTNNYVDATKEVVKELALNNVHLVDTNALIVDKQIMLDDNTHFNRIGSEKIADMFYRVIMGEK